MNSPLEVGVRGYIIPRNRATLIFLAHLCNLKRPKEFIKKLVKPAILGSNKVYLAIKSQEWTPGGLINP
jgi:hypothetical protein